MSQLMQIPLLKYHQEFEKYYFLLRNKFHLKSPVCKRMEEELVVD